MFIRKLSGFVLCVVILFTSAFSIGYCDSSRENPSREDLEKKIEEVAKKRGIPSVILKSIARVESVFKQYNSDGSVYTGRRGSIGLMQINNRSGGFDTNRLKYDINYNIEAGAEMILRKWDMATKSLPNIGNMDPNILENWYFALWAYNGWHKSNNPNNLPYKFSSTWIKRDAYQDLIYMVAEKEYGQKITPIDPKLLPKDGLPSKKNHFETPASLHYGDINMYKVGDLVKVDVSSKLRVREEPSGIEVGRYNSGDILEVIGEPKLSKGYYWYNVIERESGLEGWVTGNWVTKIGEKEDNRIFTDIDNSWSKEYVLELHNMGIVNGNNRRFYPNRHITREELCVLLSKALNLEKPDFELQYDDGDKIKDWALEHVKSVVLSGLISEYDDNTFKPESNITREEMAVILTNILGKEEIVYEIEYLDVDEISVETLDSVRNVYSKGIMKGKGDGFFKPKDYLTRAEMSKIVMDLINTFN